MSSEISTDPGLRPWQLFLLAGMLAATGVVLVSTGQALSGVIVLSLTVVTASLVAVAAHRLFAPLMAKDALEPEAPAVGRTRAALEREKALVLRTIKELEFDHAMRKTAGPEYEEMVGRLKVRAVDLLRRLDASGYRDAIERDLAARGGGTSGGTGLGVTSTAATVAATAACERCHTVNDADARFCKACGAPLAEGA